MLRARCASCRAARELLELAARRATDVALVGGAVRDLLLGRAPARARRGRGRRRGARGASWPQRSRPPAAQALARSTVHERFGTARRASGTAGAIDVAAPARRDLRRARARCPRCARAALEEDLRPPRLHRQRDRAWRSAARAAGELRARGARARGPRRAAACACCTTRSFLDDPTRLLRLARYRARLGFEIEPHTARARRARRSPRARWRRSRGARIGAELRLALGEARPGRARSRRSSELGVLAALRRRDCASTRQLARARARAAARGRPPGRCCCWPRCCCPWRRPRRERHGAARMRGCSTAASSRPPSASARCDGAVVAPRSPSALRARATVPRELLRRALATRRSRPSRSAARSADAGARRRRASARWLDELRHVRLRDHRRRTCSPPAFPPGPRSAGAWRRRSTRKLDGELGRTGARPSCAPRWRR